MLKAEIKKLVSFKLLWILLACMVCLNGYVKITKAYDRYYTPKEYTSYVSELNGMTAQEALEYTENKIDTAIENKGTSTSLWYDISEICKQLTEYPDYLTGISENAESMTAVSVWGGENTFSYRNIEKTPSAYKNIKAKELPFDTSLGVEDFLDSPITDLLAIILLFICVCRIFLHDREQGIMPLLYSAPNGRNKLILTKTATSIICCIMLVLVFYTEIFLIENYLYGFGCLSRPIQCIFGYYTCNLSVSVGEYIGLYLIMKILAYSVFAVVFSFICTISKNNLSVYGISAGICGLCYILYSKISVLSPLSLLHFWNPVQFLQIKEILGTYTNVNFFGYPVSLKISVIAVISLLLITFICLNCFIFGKTRNLHYKNITLTKKIQFKLKVHGIFYYICKRSLILQKGIVIIILALLVSIGFSQTIKRYYDNDEIYYENFCTDYAGELNDNTIKFISDKTIFYQDVENQIIEIESSDASGYFKLNELYSQLNDKNAFERFKNRVEDIPENAEIFYDTGYERFFGLDGNKEGGILLLFIMISLVFILSPVPAQDNKTNMIKIIYTTKSGKKDYFKKLLCFSAIISASLSLIVSIPYLSEILTKYGTIGISASVNGIMGFSNYPAFITVGLAMLMLIFLRTVFSIICGMIITLISSKCRGTTSAYCINIVIFVLPIVLFLIGLFG